MAGILDHNGRPYRDTFSHNGNPDRWDKDLLSGEMGRLAVPQVLTFSSLMGSAWRAYWHGRHDEAYKDSRPDALAMRRDPHLMGLLQERILAVSSLRWHLEGHDEKNPAEVALKDQIEGAIRKTPNLRKLIKAELQAIWYGRAGCQIRPVWQDIKGQPTVTVGEWLPVNGDKIGHRWDGTPYVLVSSSWADRLPSAETFPTTLGRGLLLQGRWRERFILHSHEVEDGDFFEPESAGGAYGLGLRHRLYWYWWMKQEYLEWIATYLERVGLGITLWMYDASNPEGKTRAEEAAREAGRRTNLLVPTWPDGRGGKPVGGVERVETPVSGVDALRGLQDKLDEVMERFIVGQSMSGGSDSEGSLGGTGRANFAANCVPVDSEILTRRGFKSPHEAQIGEEVLAYDVESDCCRWTPLIDKTFFSDCPVSRLSTGKRKFEAICTDDHSWAVEHTRFRSTMGTAAAQDDVKGPRGGGRPAVQERSLVKANQIRRKHNLILAAPERDTTESILTTHEAALLGWLITDGCYPKPNGPRRGFYVCQSKEEHFPAIRELMGRFVRNPTETVSKARTRAFPTGNTAYTMQQHIWHLPQAVGFYVFLKCGFSSTADLPRIVTWLNGPARQAMLDAMMAGDGSKDGTFCNTDLHIMDAFEILCMLQGLATGLLHKKPVLEPFKPCWMQRIKKGRLAYGLHIKREDAGTSDVWCPTTRYGTWVMRQGGRVLITGNTKLAITEDDSNNLGETLTGSARNPGLVWLIQSKTRPDMAEVPLRWVFDVESTESKEKLDAAKTCFDMGIPLRSDEVRGAAGFSKPAEGDETVEKPDEQAQGGPPMQEQREDPALAAQALQQEIAIDGQRHAAELAQKQAAHEQALRHEEEKHKHAMTREEQKTAFAAQQAARKAALQAQEAQRKAVLRQQQQAARAQQQAAQVQQPVHAPGQAQQPRQIGPAGYSKDWDEGAAKRDEEGKFAAQGASQGGRKSVLPPYEDDFDVWNIGEMLRDVVMDASGEPRDACLLAAVTLKRIYPDAELHYGKYLGEPHMLAKLGGYFIDVTADQFHPGEDEIKVFSPDDMPREYHGFRKEEGNNEHYWMGRQDAKDLEPALREALAGAVLFRRRRSLLARLATLSPDDHDGMAEVVDGLLALPEETLEAVQYIRDGEADQYEREWTDEDERKHPRGKDGKFGRKGGGDTATKPKKDKEESASPEWDGVIHWGNVDEGRYREWVVSFNTYDEDNQPWETDVHIQHGTYDPDPDNPDMETVDVYRWVATADGAGTLEEGEWTADHDEAEAGAREYAEENEEEAPEEDEEEEEGDGGDEVEELTGYYRTPDKILGLLGMISDQPGDPPLLEGAQVEFGQWEDGPPDRHGGSTRGFYVEITHPKLEDCQRFIGIDSRGQKFIKNEILIIKKAHTGDGLGANLFAAQVRSAAFEDFAYIKTHAAGSKENKTFNGYYTWPRFGYDQAIRSIRNTDPRLASKMEDAFPEADSVLDIMETKEGRDWWKEHGGDLRAAVFDLSVGSRSREILDAYLAERRSK